MERFKKMSVDKMRDFGFFGEWWENDSYYVSVNRQGVKWRVTKWLIREFLLILFGQRNATEV